MTTTQELLDFYSNLLIIQYTGKPKATATIEAFVGQVIADQIVQQVEDGFNLDTAIGAQLDALGTYRGAPRSIYGLNLDKQFFTMPLYTDLNYATVKGFADYDIDGASVSWYFALYSDGAQSTHILTDPELRELIQFFAKTNSAFYSLAEIDLILYEFFGKYVTLTDNGDMTITYTLNPAYPGTLFQILEILGALPRPAGVAVNVI